MTQEEFKTLQERHNAAWELDRRINDVNTVIKAAEQSGVALKIGGNDWYGLRLFISKDLHDRISEMVINALKAKHGELQKKFNEL